MNIKSLILGSATVALAATGAQAADAIIIAEPEPVEYVRVCDVYGAGYFYIPGTETCLRISGWVRHQVNGNSDVKYSSPLTFTTNTHTLTNNGVNTVTRTTTTRKSEMRRIGQSTGAQINFDARSETEYGTLRGWVQLEGFGANTRTGTDITVDINRALIQLGGLYMGYADSLFASSSNFGGSGLGNFGGFTYADSFDYFYAKKHQIGYQFSGGNGFWGAVALENNGSDKNRDKFKPDVTAKIAYQQAWGGAWLAAAYDNDASGYGVRGGVQANFSPLTVRLDGYYQSKANVEYGPTVGLTGPWKQGDGPSDNTRWGVQATGLYQINPAFGVAAGVGYYKDPVSTGRNAYGLINGFVDGVGQNGAALSGLTYNTDRQYLNGHIWTAQLGLNWTPVQNFQIGADVTYRKASVKLTEVATGVTHKGNADATAFRLRFQRNF